MSKLSESAVYRRELLGRSLGRSVISFGAVSLITAAFALTFSAYSLAYAPKLNFSFKESTANTPSGITTGMVGMTENMANDVKKLDLRLPQGTRVNSAFQIPACNKKKADIRDCPSNTKVGTAWAFTTFFLASNASGNIYMRGHTAGGRVKLTAVVDAALWIFGFPWPITNEVDMYISLDENKQLRAVANLPHGIDDMFESMTITIDKKLVITPPVCGDFRAYATFTRDDSGSPTESHFSQSWTQITSCPKKDTPSVESPEVTAGLWPNSAGIEPFMSLGVNRSDSDHEQINRIEFDLGKGLTGNPFATDETCTLAQAESNTCPPASKVGSTSTKAQIFSNYKVWVSGHLYMAEDPGSGNVGRMYMVSKLPEVGDEQILVLNVDMKLGYQSTEKAKYSDYGIKTKITNIPPELDIRSVYSLITGPTSGGDTFLRNPTQCDNPLDVKARLYTPKFEKVDIAGYWTEQGSDLVEISGSNKLTDAGQLVDIDNCASQQFSPRADIEFKEGENKPGTYPGFTLSVKPNHPKDALMKKATIKFPKGFNLNSQIQGPDAPWWGYPDPVVIADVLAHSPLTDEPLEGTLIVEGKSSSLLEKNKPLEGRLYVKGMVNNFEVKVPLDVEFKLDKDMRLVSTVSDIPELPISNLEVKMKPGMIRTPGKCMGFTLDSEFEPHASELDTQESSDLVMIEGTQAECYNPLDQPKVPDLTVSSTDYRAGKHPGVLSLEVSKKDTDHAPFGKLAITLPEGFAGNPQAGPHCSYTDAKSIDCSLSSLLGVVETEIQVFEGWPKVYVPGAVFNAKPEPGNQAKFYITLIPGEILSNENIVIPVDVKLTKGTDYRAYALALDIPPDVDVRDLKMHLFGYAGSSSKKHFLTNPTKCGTDTTPTSGGSQDPNALPNESQPFDFDLPGPAADEFEVALIGARPYQDPPNVFKQFKYVSGVLSATTSQYTVTDCDALDFSPELEWKFDSKSAASSPSSTVTVTQDYGEAHMKEAELKLPKGFKLNSLAKLSQCSLQTVDAWIDSPIGASNFYPDPVCSSHSKIGEAEVSSPLLEEPLSGPVHLIKTEPGDPLRARMFLSGLTAIAIDMTIGTDDEFRIMTEVDDAPQLPLNEIKVSLKEGIVKTPSKCGSYYPVGIFKSHSGKSYVSETEASVSEDCEAKEEPPEVGFDVETLKPTPYHWSESNVESKSAGKHIDLKMSIGQTDASHSSISRLDIAMPEGLVGTPYPTGEPVTSGSNKNTCIWEEIKDKKQGSFSICPPLSQIGKASFKVQLYVTGNSTTDVPVLLDVDGKIFNCTPDPDKQARFCLVSELPPIAGGGIIALPLDVEMSHATDYRVAATSEEIPTEFDIREIDIYLYSDLPWYEKPLLRLPTQCNTGGFELELENETGSVSTVSHTFQATDCWSKMLNFSPELSWEFGSEEAAATPNSTVTVTQNDGEDDLKDVEMTLPKGFSLNSLMTIDQCTNAIADDWVESGGGPTNDCPSSSKIGDANVASPLLLANEPLTGPIHLLETESGEPMKARMFLHGLTDVPIDMTMGTQNEFKIITKVKDAPQLPLNEIEVELMEGVIKTSSECDYHVATGDFTSHSGKQYKSTTTIPITEGCGKIEGAPTKPTLSIATLEPSEDLNSWDGLPLTDAGKNPDLRLNIDRDAQDHVKISRLDMSMSEGFLGTPYPTGKHILGQNVCEWSVISNSLFDICPPLSLIGKTRFQIQLFNTSVGTQLQQVDGNIYNCDPDPNRQARFCLVSQLPAIAGGDILALPLDVTLDKTTGYKVAASSDGIPEEFDIREIDVYLHGDLSWYEKPLLTLPTQCNEDNFKLTLHSTGGASDPATANLQATNCAAQPFKPETVVSLNPPSAFKNVKPSVVIQQPVTETDVENGYNQQAHMKSSELLFPAGLTVNDAELIDYCTPADADAWSCPDTYAVANVVAKSPLLASDNLTDAGTSFGPLSGKAFFVKEPGTPATDAKEMAIFLDGLTKVRVNGEMKTVMEGGKFRIQATFNGIPQVPVSELKLDFTKKLVQTPFIPNCPYTLMANATYSAHADEIASYASAVAITLTEGCGAP